MPGVWNNVRTTDEVLQKLRENYRELGLIIHKQEKQIWFLDTKALHMSMFYIAFQSLIFLWINSKQTSVDHQCRIMWKCFVLCSSITVVFGLNFATTVAKYMRIKYAQDRNFMDQQENYHQMAYLERLGSKNRGMDVLMTSIVDVDYMKEGNGQNEPDIFVVYQRYVHLAITASALVAVMAIVLHSCWSSTICAHSV